MLPSPTLDQLRLFLNAVLRWATIHAHYSDNVRRYRMGIFSVMAYTVSLQTHEIGVRMALGALQNDVLRMGVKGPRTGEIPQHF